MAALGPRSLEVLITEALDSQLSRLGDRLQAIRGDLRAAEAADRIGLHLAGVVGRAIAAIDERERTAVGIDLARRLIDMIRAMPAADDLAAEQRWQRGNCCAVSSAACRRPTGIHFGATDPASRYDLLTKRAGEPRVGHQIGCGSPFRRSGRCRDGLHPPQRDYAPD